MTIAVTARLAMKSSTGAHALPPSSVRHTPPPTLPAQMALVVLGCTTIARVRPPMLPGPSPTQPPAAPGPGRAPARPPPPAPRGGGRGGGETGRGGGPSGAVGTPATTSGAGPRARL